MVVDRPYNDSRINNEEFERVFDKDVLSEELVWHRDHCDRLVTVLEGNGWEIQFENQLPRKIQVGDEIWIPAKTYHRIKRGKSDLKVRIREYNEN
jgi:mannose-6-phosphate isomerase-like protein (cupin superfamily)